MHNYWARCLYLSTHNCLLRWSKKKHGSDDETEVSFEIVWRIKPTWDFVLPIKYQVSINYPKLIQFDHFTNWTSKSFNHLEMSQSNNQRIRFDLMIPGLFGEVSSSIVDITRMPFWKGVAHHAPPLAAGSNNTNLLVPSGQFGTRLQGGKDPTGSGRRWCFDKHQGSPTIHQWTNTSMMNYTCWNTSSPNGAGFGKTLWSSSLFRGFLVFVVVLVVCWKSFWNYLMLSICVG